MGKQTRRKLDVPSEQTGTIWVLGLAFFLCGVMGILFARAAGAEGADELCDYLRDYLSLLDGREPDSVFWPSFLGKLRTLMLAALLGATCLGVVGLPVVCGIQGFFFAFSVTCFCRVFGAAGLFPAFAAVGLPAMIWCPVLFLMSNRGFRRARDLLLSRQGEGGGLLAAVDWSCLCICVALLVVCALLEDIAVPILLRAAAQVVL